MDGTVLVADDDRTIRTVLTQALTRAGCKVHATASMATLIDNGFGSFFPGTNALQMLMKALAKGEAGAAAISASDVSEQKLKPDTVRALQRAAQKADHYSGAIDGRFNPVFVRALDGYARSLEQER